MVVQTFRTPARPFQTDLIRGMMRGRQIIVKGTICAAEVADVVVFTFSAGVHIMDDVIFSMTFDYYDSTVYLNSYLNNEWGEAEEIHDMPLLPGIPFEMEIDTNNDEFVVKVKGRQANLCAYQHREDPKEITIFEIEGDVDLTVVEIWDDLNIQNRIPEDLPPCPLA